MRVPAKVFAAVFFLAGTLYGCTAARQTPHAGQPGERFWRDCQEVIPAKSDGFQHFLCQDTKDRRWEVLVRREGK
jgi:hypothetical protein